jgi:hypothetical protein
MITLLENRGRKRFGLNEGPSETAKIVRTLRFLSQLYIQNLRNFSKYLLCVVIIAT